MSEQDARDKKSRIDRRYFLKMAGGMSLAAALGGCAVTPTQAPAGPGTASTAVPVTQPTVSEILIGGVHPLAGPAAFHGKAESQGIQLALEEANAAGGIKSLGGAKLVWRQGDSQGDVATGTSEAERLIREGVAVLTGLQSNVVIAITQVAERERTPIVIGLSITDQITQRGFKYTFRVGGNTILAAQGSIEALQGLSKANNFPLKRVAILRNDQEFASSLSKNVQSAAEKAGLEIAGIVEYPIETTDLTAEIQRLRAMTPDVVLSASLFDDGLLVARTIAQLRADFPALWGTLNAAFSTPNLAKELGADANYIFDNNWSLNPQSASTKELEVKAKERTGEPLNYTFMYGYVIGKVIADAVERAGTNDKEGIREALTKTEYTTDLVPWEGPVKFDETGQNISVRATATQILDGEIKLVWPIRASTAKAVFPVPTWAQR